VSSGRALSGPPNGRISFDICPAALHVHGSQFKLRLGDSQLRRAFHLRESVKVRLLYGDAGDAEHGEKIDRLGVILLRRLAQERNSLLL
jgi:hypothetical protein